MKIRRKKMKRSILFSIVIMVLLFSCSVEAGDDRAVNADNPGEEVDIKEYLQKGKTNIVDFYSDYCPPCRKISPLLAKLDVKRDDIVVIKIDINRRGIRRIDWGSPLARQFNLGSIPHFKFYDSSGKLFLEGRDAIIRVYQLLQQEGIR